MAGTAVLRPVLGFLRSPLGDNRTHPLAGIPHLRRRNPNSGIRSQSPPRSSPQANTSPKQNPVVKSEQGVQGEKSLNPPARSTFFGSFSRLLGRIGKELKTDAIGLDIISIALPAVLALAADPIASLVDTAFVGHLGSVELAAVGVSGSVFNLISKLFNVPLLNITTSFVAEEQALDRYSNNEEVLASESILPRAVDGGYRQGKKFLPAVSTSLVLAAGIGILEAILLCVFSGLLLNFMGIAVDSPMRTPAEQFLTLRALGTAPMVIALAAQGSFRGFLDTKTPLYAVCAGNLLNVILDLILIFLIGLGIDGAAIATVTSEYVIACILLWKLNMKVRLIPPTIDGRGALRYLKSGGLLIGRTIAVLVTMTLATSVAARQGPIPMAGHQICLQVWLAVSLLNDALALAGQALLASAYSKGNYKQAQSVIYKVLQIGLITGTALAILLFFGFGAFSSLFTTDSAVLDIARSGVLFVTISQPVNALAFVVDGLYYGVSDFAYAAYSMVLVGLISSIFLLAAAPVFGLPGVWTGLVLFMTLRVVAGFYRLYGKTGPWKTVWSEPEMVKK